MIWYVVRRRLRFSIDEWESLPWWQQMVYLDGIHEEFYDSEDDDESSESLDDLQQMGVRVQSVPAPPE